jgi:hypothetical protein
LGELKATKIASEIFNGKNKAFKKEEKTENIHDVFFLLGFKQF